MKIKVERTRCVELKNNEFPTYAKQFIGITGKYNMKAMFLDKSYGELCSFMPQLEAMTVYVRKNEKLAIANQSENERDTLIGCFVKAVKAFEDVDLPQVRPYIETLDAFLVKHNAKTIAKDTRSSETERISKLEKDLAVNSAVQEAISASGMLRFVVDRLFEANREYDDLFREFIAEKGAEEIMNIVILRRECTKAISQFLDAVQYCAFEHEDIDYMPLVKEVGFLNNYYNQQLKARIARRNSGKDISKEEPIEPPQIT